MTSIFIKGFYSHSLLRKRQKNMKVACWHVAKVVLALGMMVISNWPTLACAAVNPPVVHGKSPTKNTTPIWAWISGGGGNGIFRYKLDSNVMGIGATVTNQNFFTPPLPLAEGTHVLYVQEQDSAGTWSKNGVHAIMVDITPPGAPAVMAISPTFNPRPTWMWASTGGGSGTYRYKLDNQNVGLGGTVTHLTEFTPGNDLSAGLHTLYVIERDKAGNWSSRGKMAVTIKTPNAFEGAIVFLRNGELCRLKNDLSGFDILTAGYVDKFVLSPTGNKIAFTRDNTIWLMDSKAMSTAVNTGIVGHPLSLSASGGVLYYEAAGMVHKLSDLSAGPVDLDVTPAIFSGRLLRIGVSTTADDIATLTLTNGEEQHPLVLWNGWSDPWDTGILDFTGTNILLAGGSTTGGMEYFVDAFNLTSSMTLNIRASAGTFHPTAPWYSV